jgi:GTP cyclohydrolase I
MKVMDESTNTNKEYSAAINPIDYAMAAGELILKAVGEDINREGIAKTPQRFSKAIHELCSGYMLSPEQAVGGGVFPGEGKGLISIKDVEFYSLCEHHMLPFWGTASVAYYPNDKIVGLSKIPRLIDVYAKRLQVQERLTHQVCHSLHKLINARAVVVRITGCHMCMMMRGVKKHNSQTITEASIGMDKLTDLEQTRIWKSVES